MQKLKKSCALKTEFNILKLKINIGKKLDECIQKLILENEIDNQTTTPALETITTSTPKPTDNIILLRAF